MAICENLRLLRVIKNYPQKFVADKMGKCQPVYNRYETDNREVPDECLKVASELYGVPVELIKSPNLIVDLSLILTGEEKKLIKQLRTIKNEPLTNDEQKKLIKKLLEEWLGKGK